jgi:uncharacterized protein (UPF0332 family)
MVFDPTQFLDLGKRLVSGFDSTEVGLRTAVGRAYYATFLLARAKSPVNLLTGGRGASDSHWLVRSAMKKMSHEEIADKLGALATMRKTCDYDMSQSVKDTDYDEAIALADDLMQLLQGIP